jgi:D-beta-D-heptose 7-phosphate kinase / D-beta-D-heptose 1-phosphate adenosyltransferase
MTGPVVVVGDRLLDCDITGAADRLCPDAPVPVLTETGAVRRPGGAGLAATFLALDGSDVVLVGAAGSDEAGDAVRRLLRDIGVELCEVPYDGPTPEKIRLRAGAHPLLRLDRGVTLGHFARPPAAVTAAIREASAVLVSDYGRGITALTGIRRALTDVVARSPVVWDPHPKGSTPVPGARLVCPNRAEASIFSAAHGAHLNGQPVPDPSAVAAEARLLRGAWRVDAVAVTMGADGAVLAEADGTPVILATEATSGHDACGAGDRFSAAATTALAQSGSVREAVSHAIASASQYVAADGPASLLTHHWREATSEWALDR